MYQIAVLVGGFGTFGCQPNPKIMSITIILFMHCSSGYLPNALPFNGVVPSVSEDYVRLQRLVRQTLSWLQ